MTSTPQVFDCSRSKSREEDRPELHILWKTPIKGGRIPLDQFFHFRWEIKWSKYESLSNQLNGPYRTTNGQLVVKINERKIVDWSGKIGRNEEGRIPYFKAGIYNPSGYAQNAEVWIRNFAYNCSEEPCAETRTHDKCFEEESVLNRLVRADENQEVENDVLSRESRGSRSKEVCN